MKFKYFNSFKKRYKKIKYAYDYTTTCVQDKFGLPPAGVVCSFPLTHSHYFSSVNTSICTTGLRIESTNYCG